MTVRTRSRTRRVFGWLSALATMLLLVAWPVSFFWAANCTRAYPDRDWLWRRTGRSLMVGIYDGCFGMGTAGTGYRSGFKLYKRFIGSPSRCDLWYNYYDCGNSWHLTIPLWYFAAFTTICSLFAWRGPRGVAPGYCWNCRYNLKGNTSGVCPECGWRIEGR